VSNVIEATLNVGCHQLHRNTKTETFWNVVSVWYIQGDQKFFVHLMITVQKTVL